jgi:hypothetical protein
MKSIALLVLGLSSVLTVLGAGSTSVDTARFPYKIMIWEGKEGSGLSSGEIVTEPSTVTTNATTKHISTTVGQEHELQRVFVGQAGKQDVYRFTYKRPADGTNLLQQVTTSKEVKFDGTRLVIFEDARRIIVMSSPTEEDIKQAAQP